MQDVAELAVPCYSLVSSKASASSDGAQWLFAGETPGITAVHKTAAGWTRETVVSAPDTNETSVLTDARLFVDSKQGYLTYYARDDWAPHLVTWDGSCWTNKLIGEGQVASMVVATDAQQRPWVAWIAAKYESDAGAWTWSLYARNPSGDTYKLDVTADPPADAGHIRLLPGGLDGKAALPLVAVRFTDGIRLLSPNTSGASWSSLLVPQSQEGPEAGDCPQTQPSYDRGDHCAGMITCTQQVSGVGDGFDVVRTQSGAVFAAWVSYSSQGTGNDRQEAPRSDRA